ncbi:hypothetical protein [Streptomyces sp. NPDC002467]|uniref:hypothetical protein n=1 Tax=Streptomyces sp. NPDC002467 TaxID=3364647 RepID=UPI0036BC2036
MTNNDDGGKASISPAEALEELGIKMLEEQAGRAGVDAERYIDQARRQRRVRSLAPLYEVRREVRRSEAWCVLGLVMAAAVAYLIAYLAARGLFERVPAQGFQVSDAAQVITSISALATAIGAGIAAVLKAYALLVEARADIIRARAGLPPANESSVNPMEGERPQST